MVGNDIDISKKYVKLDAIKHALSRPDMYIGNILESEERKLILDSDNDKIIEKNMMYSPGLYKIFDELIVNTYDQSIRDDKMNTIKVCISKKEISVYNNGIGIDVLMHPKEKIYVPELIFGNLRTSTTFNTSNSSIPRITGGMNGLGAKLTGIYSTYFKIDIGDTINKKSYSQLFEKNMSKKSIPKIGKYDKNGGDGYVKITFRPDLKYFNNITEISEDMIKLMERRVYDLGGTINNSKKMKIYLNGNKINVSSFDDYVSKYTDNAKIKNVCVSEQVDKIDRWNVIITKSDGNHKSVSFVNGINTQNDGRHVEYITNRVIKNLKEYIEKKYKTSRISSQYLKDSFWIFINSVIEDAGFCSQTKDTLKTPISKFGSTCEISKDIGKKIIAKFGLEESIKHQIVILKTSDLSKIDKTPKKTVKGIKKLYDANYAGTKKSSECTLILTEGDSAKATAISGLSALGNKGNNIYGVFPLKGKLLNVREASHKQIMTNEEFKNVKHILGLETNKIYTEENRNSLRYGKIILMMDADVDGSHIKGLFINMIHYFWSSLLKLDGFLQMFITPVVKLTNKINKSTISFYNMGKYEEWKNNNNNKLYDAKYYKGLGTNTSAEAKEYFNKLDEHLMTFKWDKNGDKVIELGFSKDKIEERKKWLKCYDKNKTIDNTKNILTMSQFIHDELKHFSNYDNIRSIPHIMDGLKPSQRKILYGCFKRNLINDVKVSQLVGYISEHTGYHHGEMSLTNTIISMAQNFVGSNNINLLSPMGQFGTRLMGGKDHSSSRYIFTKLENITRYIYHKDDDELLTYNDDDGYPIEPEFYVPIIPMILVNGSEGIGTGYSTYIPKYNPFDIIDYLSNKITNKTNKLILTPWYNNFIGTIIKKDNNSFISKGIYEIDSKKSSIIIKELPITSWTESYKYNLELLINKEPFIKSIKNNSTDKTVNITIKYSNNSININDKLKPNNELDKLLGMSRVINKTNMHLHNKNNIITKYNQIEEIINEYYEIRLDYYKRRKDNNLKKLESELDLLSSKIKFINLVLKKEIVLFNKSLKEIISILKKYKLKEINGDKEYKYLTKMSFLSLTDDKIISIKKLHMEKTELYKNISSKEPKQLWLDDLNILKNKLSDYF